MTAMSPSSAIIRSAPKLDEYGGFGICVLAITTVYALILPALLLVPNHVIATADEQIK
jgi:hypothetical protein